MVLVAASGCLGRVKTFLIDLLIHTPLPGPLARTLVSSPAYFREDNVVEIPRRPQTMTVTATALKQCRSEKLTPNVLLSSFNIVGYISPSWSSWFVAVIVVAVMVIVCGRHGLWPLLSNPVENG